MGIEQSLFEESNPPPTPEPESKKPPQTIPFAKFNYSKRPSVTPTLNDLYDPTIFATLLTRSRTYHVPNAIPPTERFLLDFLVEHPEGDEFLYQVIREGFGLKHLETSIKEFVNLVWWLHNIKEYLPRWTPQELEEISRLSLSELNKRFQPHKIVNLYVDPDTSHAALLFLALTGTGIAKYTRALGPPETEGRCLLKAALRSFRPRDGHDIPMPHLYSCWDTIPITNHYRHTCIETSLVPDPVPKSEVLNLLKDKKYLISDLEELITEYLGEDNFWTLPLVKETPYDPNFTPFQHRRWFFENIENIKINHTLRLVHEAIGEG